MKKIIKPAHTTTDEIKFIRNIGTHADRPMPSKRFLLKNYLDALSKRANWEHLDRQEIERVAWQELANIELSPV